MKKILFNSSMDGNIKALVDYYNNNELKGYKVTFKDHSKCGKKLTHYFHRLWEYVHTYDLIVSEFSTRLYKRAKKGMYISHGYGTKASPGLEDLANPNTMKIYKLLRENVDFVITLGKRDEEYFWKCDYLDQFKEPKYVPLGLPRIDQLLDVKYREMQEKEIKEKYVARGKKVLLYCPTWRHYDTQKLFPMNKEDFSKLNQELEDIGWVMFYRPHYISSIFPLDYIKGLSNIFLVDFQKEPSTQKILMATDALITDYSSIYVDYLVLNKPIMFMPFDLELYIKERGLVISFDNLIETPGPKVSTIKDIVNYLKDIDDGKDKYKSTREAAQRLYYDHLDGDSCKKVWDFIDEILKEG